VGLAFSVLTGAGIVSLRRDRLLDTYGQPAVGHVMKLDPINSRNGRGAYVTYRFWIDGDNTRYSHTGTFTGQESSARVSQSMVSGAVVRKTIPVRYLPSDPRVNRPDDPDPNATGFTAFYLAISAVTALLGWVMCVVASVRWARAKRRGGAPRAEGAAHSGGAGAESPLHPLRSTQMTTRIRRMAAMTPPLM
jgi:hypothetical protein